MLCLRIPDYLASVSTNLAQMRRRENNKQQIFRYNHLLLLNKNGAPGEIRTPDRLVRSVTAQPRLPNDLIELLGFLLSNSFRLYGVICPYLQLYWPFYWTAKTVVSPSHQPDYYRVMSRSFASLAGYFCCWSTRNLSTRHAQAPRSLSQWYRPVCVPNP